MSGDEFFVRNVAELIDLFKPGSVPCQVGLVVLKDILLVLLQSLCSLLLLLGVLNWRKMENLQELIFSQLYVGVQFPGKIIQPGLFLLCRSCTTSRYCQ